MFKSASLPFIISISAVWISCHSAEAQDATSQVITATETEILLKHPREIHETSFHRTISDKYYCDSHLLEVETTLRREISDENWFFQVDMEAKLDRKNLELSEYLGKLTGYQYQTDFAIQYHCINSQITIIILLDQGTAVPFSTPIGRIYIDVDTGELMGEPRKSPKH